MDKVLDITGRIEGRKRRQQAEDHRDQIEAIRRLVQCACCEMKCAMCGQHAGGPEATCPDTPSPLGVNLCENCRAEFEAFLDLSDGHKRPPVFWRNKQWRNLWAAWLQYQEALRDFRNSTEFELLTRELD